MVMLNRRSLLLGLGSLVVSGADATRVYSFLSDNPLALDPYELTRRAFESVFKQCMQATASADNFINMINASHAFKVAKSAVYIDNRIPIWDIVQNRIELARPKSLRSSQIAERDWYFSFVPSQG